MELWRGFMNIASCEMRRDGPSGIRRHRAAEIVASQGSSSPRAPAPIDPLSISLRPSQDYSRPRTVQSFYSGSGSFVFSPSGYPSQLQSHVPSEVLGGHLPCTAAALGDKDGAVPGRGLYVSMQRGLGKAPSIQETSQGLELPRRPAKIRSESPGRMMTAAQYEGAAEDTIDEALAVECKRLPAASAKALNIRRIAPGEYEVDGVPVRFSWEQEHINNTMKVVVHRLGEEDQGAEALSRFLPRAANEALTKSPLNYLELPTFPWPKIDQLSRTMNARKVLPLSTAVPPGGPVMPVAPPTQVGSSLQLQPPRSSQAAQLSPSFLLPPRGPVTRSPSLVVPVPGRASHNLPMPFKIR